MTVRVGINGFGRIGRNVGDSEIRSFAERDPQALKWGDVEATGFFTDAGLVRQHISSGGRAEGDRCEVARLAVRGCAFGGARVRSRHQTSHLGAPSLTPRGTKPHTSRHQTPHLVGHRSPASILPAPASHRDITVAMGVNHQGYDPESHDVVSNASCTTSCLAPMAKVLQDAPGIERGLVEWGYSNRLVDLALHVVRS